MQVNGPVIRGAGEAIAQFAPSAVVIVVTNPLDEMTYELWRASGLGTGASPRDGRHA